MTIEEKLKKHILTKHKSIREFVKYADLPYSTVDGILKRGIANSSIGNVLKICKALQISADELANGKIVPTSKQAPRHVFFAEIPEMLEYMRNHPDEYSDLTVDGQPLNQVEWETMLNSLTLSVSFVRNIRNDKINV
jgi:hypothetical protein